MSHIPVNHPLRPLYRVVSALTAGSLLMFGAVGLSQTSGSRWFAQGDYSALGLSTNRAFAVTVLVAGALVLLAALVGRNLDRLINLWGGVGFLGVGTVMMALLETESNVLNFSMATVIASYVIGMLLVTAGLYSKVGPVERAVAEEALRADAR